MSCVDAWLDSLPCDIIQTDIQTDIQKDLRHITPPKSVEQSQFRKRKRSQTFNAVGFMSPKKRKRDGMVGSEVESQPSASVEPPVSFSTESRQTASSSPKRSKSPARDAFNSLRYCTPAIDCRQPETKVAVLPSAIALRTHLTKGFGQRVIPIELKALMLEIDPYGTLEIPDFAYHYKHGMDKHELKALWKSVQEIIIDARSNRENNQDESAWCLNVVQPTLRLALRISKATMIKSVYIQTQSIDPTLIPSLAGVAINKKADFALAFDDLDPHVASVYEKYDERIPDCPISQMSNAYTKRLAMLCGIEVKREGGDATEALAQYSIWAAAGMERLRTLGIASNLPVRPRKDILPQVGWTVVGHDWRTYITCGDELNEKKWFVLGPFDILRTGTSTYYGIFKLIDVIKRVEEHGRVTYWPWLCDGILQPSVVSTEEQDPTTELLSTTKTGPTAGVVSSSETVPTVEAESTNLG